MRNCSEINYIERNIVCSVASPVYGGRISAGAQWAPRAGDRQRRRKGGFEAVYDP